MSGMKSNSHSRKEDFHYLLRGMKLINRLEPKLLWFGISDNILKALKPFVSIYFTARILDELLGARSAARLVLYVALLIGLNFLLSLEIILSSRRDVCILSLSHKQVQMMSEKIMTMDYQNAEDANMHKMYQQIQDRCFFMGRDLWAVEEKAENLVRCAVTIAASVGLAIPLFFTSGAKGLTGLKAVVSSPWFSAGMAVIVIISAAVSVVLSIRQNTRELELSKDDEFNLRNRVFDFYTSYLEDYKTGKDVRLYRQENLIMKEINRALEYVMKLTARIAGMRGNYAALRAAISVGAAGLVYLFVGLKALAGLLLVGGIVRYTGSITQFIEGLSTLMNQLADLSMMTEDFRLYFEFIDYPNVQVHGGRSIEQTENGSGAHEIVFDNVSFRYPGTEADIIKNVNLKLKYGVRMAVVGMNGSGKTTMIKLLCRLYDPTEGRILLDGTDIREYDLETYQKLFAVVFQDYKLFAFSIGENVTVSDEYDKAKAETALRQAGIWERIEKMEKRMETPIYKECYEDGVEISGGEAQKIAIARALYRDAPFVILDEPTAALDPISEFEIYSRFDEMIQKKTAVYISHRLSSCRFCHNIAVFDDGRIVQQGSHEELLKQDGGKYSALWNAQAQYYADGA